LPEPRRIRDREHVRFVARQPCLICGRLPTDAHHLRFTQNPALGRKVSDEFTASCVEHHREVHRCGNETAWWQHSGIDPTLSFDGANLDGVLALRANRKSHILLLYKKSRAFVNHEMLRRQVSGNKKFGMHHDATLLIVNGLVGGKIFELSWWNEITDLFIDLAHHALQIAFAVFAVATEQADLTWVYNLGFVVTLLQQKSTESVEQDCTCNFATPVCAHDLTFLPAGGCASWPRLDRKSPTVSKRSRGSSALGALSLSAVIASRFPAA
jgi:hypothetical protein